MSSGQISAVRWVHWNLMFRWRRLEVCQLKRMIKKSEELTRRFCLFCFVNLYYNTFILLITVLLILFSSFVSLVWLGFLHLFVCFFILEKKREHIMHVCPSSCQEFIYLFVRLFQVFEGYPPIRSSLKSMHIRVKMTCMIASLSVIWHTHILT